jgi:DNA-binding winged helix-turn-helix (wHTH) protein
MPSNERVRLHDGEDSTPVDQRRQRDEGNSGRVIGPPGLDLPLEVQRPTAPQLFVLLLDEPGRVVTREEIRTLLWPDTTVDFDHSLDVALNRLRVALGDSGKEPRFVETVPRIGYRFVAQVHTAIDRPRAIRGRSIAARVGLYALTAIIAALIALAIVHQHYDKFVDRPGRASSTR